MQNEYQAFWKRYRAATGDLAPAPVEYFQFGDTAEMANELAALVMGGRKTATCALARWYGGPDSPQPRPGDLFGILDGSGRPRCVIQTVAVETRTILDVDANFAWAEGEGDRSLAWWRQAHRDFWQREAAREGFDYSDTLDVVLHRFACLWQE
jgi:uncharacterized protein YhfF